MSLIWNKWINGCWNTLILMHLLRLTLTPSRSHLLSGFPLPFFPLILIFIVFLAGHCVQIQQTQLCANSRDTKKHQQGFCMIPTFLSNDVPEIQQHHSRHFPSFAPFPSTCANGCNQTYTHVNTLHTLIHIFSADVWCHYQQSQFPAAGEQAVKREGRGRDRWKEKGVCVEIIGWMASWR